MDDSKRMEMEGKRDQVRGRVKESWGVLTEKTGEAAGDVERKLRELMG